MADISHKIVKFTHNNQTLYAIEVCNMFGGTGKCVTLGNNAKSLPKGHKEFICRCATLNFEGLLEILERFKEPNIVLQEVNIPEEKLLLLLEEPS